MTKERREKRSFDEEFKAEDTIKTQAAKKLIDAAEVLGILGRLFEQLSRRYGRFGINATDSPSLAERRKKEWHGEGEKEKVIVFEDHTNTGGDIGSKLSELPAKERWKVFQRRERQEREKRSSKKNCQED